MTDIKKPNEQDPSASGEETAGGKSRRDLLKGLATGSAVVAGQEVLPDKWAKPLLDTVALPTHAETTPDDDNSNNPDGSTDNELADDFRDEGEDGSGDLPDEGTDDLDADFNDDSGLADGPQTDET